MSDGWYRSDGDENDKNNCLDLVLSPLGVIMVCSIQRNLVAPKNWKKIRFFRKEIDAVGQ